MRAFVCDHCGLLLFFENSLCLRCGTPQGFVPSRLDLATLEPGSDDGRELRRCANQRLAECNRMRGPGEPGPLCLSCRLTRTRPNDADLAGLAGFAKTEGAKRRVLAVLMDIGLPDLAEADDAIRAQRRAELGEPYRTMVGHLRHELGHFYEPILSTRRARAMPSASCSATSARTTRRRWTATTRRARRRLGAGPRQRLRDDAPVGGLGRDLLALPAHPGDESRPQAPSASSSTGPPEADDPGLMAVPQPRTTATRPSPRSSTHWLPLTYALNAVNRCMGLDDLYPFILGPKVIQKLSFIHGRVAAL